MKNFYLKMISILLLSWVHLALFGCAKESIEPSRVDEVQVQEENLQRVSRSDVLGEWFMISDSQYAHSVITITALKNGKALLNGDTICLNSSTDYVGCNSPYKIQTGTLFNGVLTHCELYSDPATQMSYYVCARYR